MSDTKILVLSGRKQSGKTTACNFLCGYIMQVMGITKVFDIDDNGNLLVYAKYKDEKGEEKVGMGLMDLSRKDMEFIQYLSDMVWPFIKIYSFADTLKSICISVFGLTYLQCYGSNEDKNTLTSVKWNDIKFALHNHMVGNLKKENKLDQFLTAREFLQIFGTEVCRKIMPNCWVDACFRQIELEQPSLAVISDGRFPNEIEASLNRGAKVIRFTRSPFKGLDEHDSEKAMDEWDNNPELRAKLLYIDNAELNVHQQNIKLLQELVGLGLLPAEV